MLKAILARETCAKCQNCCVFEEQSAWELPSFDPRSVERLPNPAAFDPQAEGGKVRLTLSYDGGGARPCPFLNPESGCTLPVDEKPFACSVWPLRVMKDRDGTPKLALYAHCPGVGEAQMPALNKLLDEGLRERIFEEISKDPGLIKPFHENYRFLPE